MWKNYNPGCGIHHSCEYQLKGAVVAVIKPHFRRDDARYIGFIIHFHFDTVIRLEGDNLELLKLKCLLKAKDLGWDINNLF